MKRRYAVTVVVPTTLIVWAEDEEDAKKQAFLNEDAIKAIGIPVEITVREVTHDDARTRTH